MTRKKKLFKMNSYYDRNGQIPKKIIMSNDDVVNIISQYQEYSCLNTSNFYNTLPHKIYNIYMMILKIAKRNFNMELLINDGNQLIENTFIENTKEIFNEPSRILNYYPSMFNQKLSQLVSQIYNQVDEFAKITVNFFEKYESHLTIFSYSTFPSLFGMFIADEFCKYACKFIISVFEISKNSAISDALLTSFFFGASIFYESLWQNISASLRYLNKNSTFHQFFEMTKNALNSSLPNLSIYHTKALSKYCNFSQKRCNQLFVEKLLLEPFIRVSSSSAYFPSPIMNSLYINFLKQLMSPLHILHILELLNCIVSNTYTLDVNPKFSVSCWTKGIPIILNDYDVLILYKLTQKKPGYFNLTYILDDVKFNQSLRPLIIDIFPSCIKIEADDQILHQLLGDYNPILDNPDIIFKNKDEILRSEEAKNDSIYSNIYRRHTQYALEKNQNIATFYLNNINGTYFSNPEYRKFCGLKIISRIHKNFEHIKQAIILFQHYSTLRKIRKYIELQNNSMYFSYSCDFFRRKVPSNDCLAASLEDFDGIPAIKSNNYFEFGCVALEYVNYPTNKKISILEDTFARILSFWMEKKWPTYKQKCHFNQRIKHILDTATLLGQIQTVNLGKGLKIILQFQKNLYTILNPYWDQEWSILFHYAIYAANSPKILSLFLTLHHLVFTNDGLVQNWGEHVYSLWSMFSAGMWYVIKADREFCLQCSNFDDIKDCFNLS